MLKICKLINFIAVGHKIVAEKWNEICKEVHRTTNRIISSSFIPLNSVARHLSNNCDYSSQSEIKDTQCVLLVAHASHKLSSEKKMKWKQRLSGHTTYMAAHTTTAQRQWKNQKNLWQNCN